VAVKRDAGSVGASAKSNARRKRRLRPPWGTILGGKPIERQAWYLNKRHNVKEVDIRREQYRRMLRLKDYYRIKGGDYDYPVRGVGPADWLPWYELALSIASEFDDSLKVVDAAPLRKTTARWRGMDGLILLKLVDIYRERHPRQSALWCLRKLHEQQPAFVKMPLKQLVARYYEAKRHHRATKQ
jgi:hypothetical protein